MTAFVFEKNLRRSEHEATSHVRGQRRDTYELEEDVLVEEGVAVAASVGVIYVVTVSTTPPEVTTAWEDTAGVVVVVVVEDDSADVVCAELADVAAVADVSAEDVAAFVVLVGVAEEGGLVVVDAAAVVDVAVGNLATRTGECETSGVAAVTYEDVAGIELLPMICKWGQVGDLAAGSVIQTGARARGHGVDLRYVTVKTNYKTS